MENTLTRLNASAGSGKTYSLVKNYLITLLKSTNPKKFRQLLAITFTNKAVAEMKSRVLETLAELADYKEGDLKPTMLDDLVMASGLTPEIVRQKANEILGQILHNYAGFDVVTIDTLTHRIIRTFSKDFGLSGNFEVSLDLQSMTALAVDALIARAGQDEEITQTLVDFSLQKIDEDKSWDISYDLNEIAQLLHNENDAKAIKLLKNKSLADYKKLDTDLSKFTQGVYAKMQELAIGLLDVLDTLGLEQRHFSSGYFYKFIVQARETPEKLLFTGAKWKSDIASYDFYKKAEKQEIKDTIDTHKAHFITVFETLRKLFYQAKLKELFRARLIPLSVLQLIQRELDIIKEEDNVVLISDFNKIIGQSLKDQPAAFIYERLGERYSNYFIDEFQDTSVLQWSNLIPLIDNAISSLSMDGTPNSLLIVGDPKQAIYRWRGGEAEQFMKMGTTTQPFTLPISQDTLDTNYRSHEEIINFNNGFFTHLASVFEHPDYQNIYVQDNNQHTNHRKGGLVSLRFTEAQNNVDDEEIYPEKIIEIIEEVTAGGRPKSDICILVRSNKDGAHIAQVLTQRGILVVSSESLLIASSPIVVFINAVVSMLQHPDDPAYRLEVLYFLGEHLGVDKLHHFYAYHIDLGIQEFFDSLDLREIHFKIDQYESLGLYERLEYIIRSFSLQSFCDAYVIAYLDLAQEYALKNLSSITGFLRYWEEKSEKASIAAPAQNNAVLLMSIHKSKGLEFPIVIYPYADSKLYRTQGEHHWYPSSDESFETLMISHAATLEHIDETTLALYQERRNQQLFDAINVLYVALTRAVEQLYVVLRFRESKEGTSTYNDLFIQYLKAQGMWEGEQRNYTFGSLASSTTIDADTSTETLTVPFTSTSRNDIGLEIAMQAAFLWDEKREEARGYGNLVHAIMAKVKYRSQEKIAVEEAIYEGLLSKIESKKLLEVITAITNHPALTACFDPKSISYSERAILSSTGHYHVPDRVEVHPDGSATLIDYKTGVREKKHIQQLITYSDLLKEMNFNVTTRLLIYINERIEVEVV